jgi:DDE family transposase
MDATIAARSLDAGVASQRCERNRVDFVFGLARNPRPVEEIPIALAGAEEEAARTGRPARRYKDFRWSTLDGWSRRRRVIGKAEWTRGEANPRFLVTSLQRGEIDARVLCERVLCERVYCARGDMENRVEECQLDLSAGRASAATMRANQPRLWFAAMAYVPLCALRRIGLAHTRFAEATCGSIRLALLKIGALARRSVRRSKLAMASAHPHRNEFALAHTRLTAAVAPWRTRHRKPPHAPTTPSSTRRRDRTAPARPIRARPAYRAREAACRRRLGASTRPLVRNAG